MGRRRLAVLVCLALGAVAAAAYTWQAPREYAATTRIFVGIDVPASDRDESDAVYVAMAPAKDFARFATSEQVAALATGRLGGGAEALVEAVEAEVVEDTTLIDLTATDEDPRRARDIAAAFADVMVAESREEPVAGMEFIARVIERARIPDDAEPQPWLRNLGIGAGGGLLVGLAVAIAVALGTRSARPTPAAG